MVLPLWQMDEPVKNGSLNEKAAMRVSQLNFSGCVTSPTKRPSDNRSSLLAQSLVPSVLVIYRIALDGCLAC